MGKGGMRLLLIDDDEERIALLSGTFGSDASGGELAIARTATVGLESARAARPDLVFLGLDVPGSGIDVRRALHDDPATRDIRVICLAGRDATHKEAEQRVRLACDVLELLNEHSVVEVTIRVLLPLIRQGIGVDAVGVRLREGEDFPYYETNGFSEEFVLLERSLCARDAAGQVVRDSQGAAVLECLCGAVISGRGNPRFSHFTTGGSFWTNGMTDLLASTTKRDGPERARNRCSAAGYESLVLVPLRSHGETIGLLQLNDRRRDRFTEEAVRFLEGLGASIGIALARQRDIAERMRLEREILGIAERERRHVGHELHDRVCQLLTAVLLRGELLRRGRGEPNAADDPRDEHLKELCALVEEARSEAHQLAKGLVATGAPSSDVGLTLEAEARVACERFGVSCEFRQSGDPVMVDGSATMALQRICQEAIANAVRHGAPSQIEVEIARHPHELRLTIDDDGCGFGEIVRTGNGMGLRIMQYRARSVGGRLDAGPRPGGGTRVTVSVPLSKVDA